LMYLPIKIFIKKCASGACMIEIYKYI